MTQPLARIFIGIRVVGRLTHHFYFHFSDAYSRTSMIWNVEVAGEWAQLLKLELVYESFFAIGH